MNKLLDMMSVSGTIALLVVGGCLLLLALFFFLFRKLKKIKRDNQDKEKYLQKLAGELQQKESLQQKAFAVISNVEDSSQRLGELVDEIARLYPFQFLALVFRDCVSDESMEFQHPHPLFAPGALLEYFERKRSHQPDSQPPAHPERGWEQELGESWLGKELLSPTLFCPLGRVAVWQGVLIFSLPEENLKSAEKDLQHLASVFEALLSYRNMHGEIGLRTEEVNTVFLFLNETTAFAYLDKLLDSIFTFYKDTYAPANVTLLLEDEEGEPLVRNGQPLAEELLLELIPAVRRELEKGRPMVYAPDRYSLVKKFSPQHSTEAVQALLVVPLRSFNKNFGYIVFESATPNPFKTYTLNSLVRLTEIGAFVLRLLLHFQSELNKRFAEIKAAENITGECRLQIAQLQAGLEEKERVIRDMSDFNSIFTISSNIRQNLASLKGFIQMVETNLRNAAPKAHDPVLFRNCLVEAEKIERQVQKFELTRILTDPDFVYRRTPTQLGGLFENVFGGIRSKAVMKKLELELRLQQSTEHAPIDREITGLVLKLFMDRLLDFLSQGKMVVAATPRGVDMDLTVSFTPSDPARLAALPGIEVEVRKDFHFLTLRRAVQGQGGEVSLSLPERKALQVQVILPGNEEVPA